MKKGDKKSGLGFSDLLASFRISHGVFLVLLGAVVALGGTYEEYTITRGERGPDGGQRYVMTRVIDGDTLEIEGVDERLMIKDKRLGQYSSERDRIRLVDVNAPELGMCYGVEAQNALEKLLLGQDLLIEKDISGSDDFGRLVRYVKVIKPSKYDDNILVNKWMLENGYAIYKESENSLHQKEMLNAQATAQTQGRGLWGECSDEERAQMGVGSSKVSAQPSDPACTIKGNITDVEKKKVYLLPYCPNYNTTKINLDIGEKFFCSEEDALRAGFRRSETCGNRGARF
jgi:micrococcal nuclease